MSLPRVPTSNNQQYTLDAQIAAGANSLTLNQSVAGVIRAPGYVVVDRIDTSGNKTPTKREYKKFTGVSGAQLTGLSNVDGTDQVHAVGAIVEVVPDVKYEQDWYDWGITEHDTSGVHASLPSLTYVRSVVGDFGGVNLTSNASIRTIETLSLVGASQASIRQVNVGNLLNFSGASLTGQLPVVPVWVIPGAVSAATVAVGKPLDMPQTGYIEYASVVLRSPVSSASLVLDINKNFTTIFTDQNTRLSILGGGTFASTASIAVKTYNRGDIFSVDVDAGGSLADITVKFRGI